MQVSLALAVGVTTVFSSLKEQAPISAQAMIATQQLLNIKCLHASPRSNVPAMLQFREIT